MMQTAATPFGVLLRQHRIAAGLTQEALAERAQVSARVISDLERQEWRTPRAYTVRQLLAALPLSPEAHQALLIASQCNTSRQTTSHEPAPPSRPLPVGSFLGARPSSPLIAREAEVARLVATIDTVLAGRGTLVALVGEAGIGKTRLAQDVGVRAQDRGFVVAAGSCYEAQQTTPFFPFLDLMTALYHAAPGMIRTVVPQQFPYLPALLLDHQLSLPRPTDQGAEDQERLFWSVVTFVQACAAHHPVALLLDDLHWADRSSLELVQRLARQTRNHAVLLLVTYRDVAVRPQHPLEAALGELTRQQLLTRIPVRHLAEEETARLVATVFEAQEISKDFASLLYERTEGNPFLLQQVLQVLVERGDVYREEGRWTRKAIGELGVPESIRAAVGQRVTRLSEQAQQILGEASVLGQTFLFDDVAGMAEHTESTVEQGLEEVLQTGLIRDVDGDRYAFDHALTQQVVYEELTTRRRRRLHLAAGSAIEGLPKQQRTGRVAELAWHFQQGRDLERGLRYTLQAGDQAKAVYAHQAAERHYQRALELARLRDDRHSQAEAAEKLGIVLWNLNRRLEALPVCEDALTLYHALADVDGELRAAHALSLVWPPHRAGELIRRVQRLLDRTPERPSPARAQLVAAMAWTYVLDGRVGEVISIAQRAIELAEASGDRRAERDARHVLALGFAATGRLEQARDTFETTVALAETLDDAFSLAESLIMLGWIHHLSHDRVLAETTTARGLEIARGLGSAAGIALGTINLGEIAFDVGEWEDAERYFTEAVSLGRIEDKGTDPAANLLYLRLLRGDQGAASELARLTDHPASWAARYLAEWELLVDQPATARDRVETALTRGVAAQFRPGWEALRAESLVMLDQVDHADALLAPTVAQPGPVAYPTDPIQCLRVLGMIRAAQGRWDDARALFERALTESEGYPFVHAQVHRTMGQVLQGRDDDAAARAHLEAALSLFNRLGAGVYAVRTEAILGAPGLS